MQKIAVQEGLDRVKNYLAEKGYAVETIGFNAATKAQDSDYRAIVLTGLSKDFMGISDTVTRVPVIDATGMTEEEIFKRVEKELQ